MVTADIMRRLGPRARKIPGFPACGDFDQRSVNCGVCTPRKENVNSDGGGPRDFCQRTARCTSGQLIHRSTLNSNDDVPGSVRDEVADTLMSPPWLAKVTKHHPEQQ